MHHDITNQLVIDSLNRKIVRTKNVLNNKQKKIFIYYRHYYWSFNLCSDLNVLINESLDFCKMYKKKYNFYLLTLIVSDQKIDTDKINSEVTLLRQNENTNLKFDFLYKKK